MLLVFGVLAFFMLIMVAMGLLGVLWQTVAQRTAEVGVRRAKGATRQKIYLQFTGEFLVLATLATGLALIAVAQVPILGIAPFVPGVVYIKAFLASAVIIYTLVSCSSLYPSWLATRINPAEALHYE